MNLLKKIFGKIPDKRMFDILREGKKREFKKINAGIGKADSNT